MAELSLWVPHWVRRVFKEKGENVPPLQGAEAALVFRGSVKRALGTSCLPWLLLSLHSPTPFPYHDLLVVVSDVGVVVPGRLGVGFPHFLSCPVVLGQELFSLCLICYFV